MTTKRDEYAAMQTCFPPDVDDSLRVMAGRRAGTITPGREWKVIAKALLHIGATLHALRSRP